MRFQLDMIDRNFLCQIVPKDRAMINQELDRDQHAIDEQRMSFGDTQVAMRHILGQRSLADDDWSRGNTPTALRQHFAMSNPLDGTQFSTQGANHCADLEFLNRGFPGGCRY